MQSTEVRKVDKRLQEGYATEWTNLTNLSFKIVHIQLRKAIENRLILEDSYLSIIDHKKPTLFRVLRRAELFTSKRSRVLYHTI